MLRQEAVSHCRRDVVSGAAAAEVGGLASDQDVVAAFPQQHVAATVAREPVVAGPADQMVVAIPTAGAVDVERALEHVVPAEAEEDVAAEATREVVGTGRPDDRDRPAEAAHELVRAAVTVGSRRAALVGRGCIPLPSAHGGTVRLQGVGRRGPAVLSRGSRPRVDTREVAGRGEAAAL